MLIILALVLALALIAYTQLSKTVAATSEKVEQRTADVLGASERCSLDSDCKGLGQNAVCLNGACVLE